MDFNSAYSQGFLRVCSASVPVFPADVERNVEQIVTTVSEAEKAGCAVVAFPSLSLTGCTVGDIFTDPVLLENAQSGAQALRAASTDLLPVIVVGLPVPHQGQIFNVALVIHRGVFLGAVPQQYFAPRGPLSQLRSFTPFKHQVDSLAIAGEEVPAGNLIFKACGIKDFAFSVEVGADGSLPLSPALSAAALGATFSVHLEDRPAFAGSAREIFTAAAGVSERLCAARLVAWPGAGESTSDLTWAGGAGIFECGSTVATGRSQVASEQALLTIADIDLTQITAQRQRSDFFAKVADANLWDANEIIFDFEAPAGDIGLRRNFNRYPFLYEANQCTPIDCEELFDLMVGALVKRLRATGDVKVVLGVSGGLDSTLALAVSAAAMDLCERKRSDILAYTMPGFGTSERTKSSALGLCAALQIPCQTLDIRPAATQMLADLGHPYARGEEVFDVTFENVQAGLRSDYLFRIANNEGGLVLGTGDLSELALGWCTYGVGDHISHYAINAGVPKTLIRHLVRWLGSSGRLGTDLQPILEQVLNTAVSPELIPIREGHDAQATESTIGPYDLHDFTLFHLLSGHCPERIAFLARHVWTDAAVGNWPTHWPEADQVAYTWEQILHWEETFYRRFFVSQFKRTCSPGGPALLAAGSLSPRGGLDMPSDLSGSAWAQRFSRLREELAH